jgi:hypothetical protein
MADRGYAGEEGLRTQLNQKLNDYLSGKGDLVSGATWRAGESREGRCEKLTCTGGFRWRFEPVFYGEARRIRRRLPPDASAPYRTGVMCGASPL